MGWELGAGFGHVQPLLRVAKELAQHGHRPVFAVKNLLEAAPLLNSEPFPVLQSPLWPARPARVERAFQAASYADILAIRGFGDPDELYPLVRGWQSLIDVVRPDLIVCDHSPTLCVAAYRSVPVVMIGTGFTVPPVEISEFPSLQPQVAAQMPQQRILDVVREVQRRQNRPVPETLPAIFADATRFVCTQPELDPYQAVRQEPAVGGLNPLPAAPLANTPPSFFAYLAGDYPGVESLLAFLAGLRIPGSAYVRGGSRRMAEGLRQKGLHVYDTPAPMHEVLPRVSAILHHGGLCTAEDALTTGRPQLLLPRYLEQKLTAQALQRAGVAHFLGGKTTVQSVGQALHQVIADPRLAKQAMAVAERIQQRGLTNPLPRIVEHCLQKLS
jgi:UDP:flavonoid glycosyltransferase YjiC (YdhE family)